MIVNRIERRFGDSIYPITVISPVMGVADAVKSFVFGIVLTLILVVAVPVIVDSYVQTYISDLVGDTSFLTLSSEVIVNLLVWIVIIGFMIVLGAGGILKRYGIFGIAGLVVAYYLLGDVTDAFIPLATLAIVLVLSKTMEIKRHKKMEKA